MHASTSHKYINVIKENYLFSDLSDDVLLELINTGGQIKTFKKDEEIWGEDSLCRGVGIILDGKARVEKLSHTVGRVVLNILSRSDSFGIATLFSNNQVAVSRIISAGSCEVLLIDENRAKEIILTSREVSEKYITLLSEKLCFLNKRIDRFTMVSARDKCTNYILELSMENAGGMEIELPVNVKQLSLMLGIGRASLYRVMDSLEEEKIIKKDGKTITILEFDRLIKSN